MSWDYDKNVVFATVYKSILGATIPYLLKSCNFLCKSTCNSFGLITLYFEHILYKYPFPKNSLDIFTTNLVTKLSYDFPLNTITGFVK